MTWSRFLLGTAYIVGCVVVLGWFIAWGSHDWRTRPRELEPSYWLRRLWHWRCWGGHDLSTKRITGRRGTLVLSSCKRCHDMVESRVERP